MCCMRQSVLRTKVLVEERGGDMSRVLSDCHMRFGQVLPPFRIWSTVRRARSGGKVELPRAAMCPCALHFWHLRYVRYERKLPCGGIRTLPKPLPTQYLKVLMVKCGVRRACLHLEKLFDLGEVLRTPFLPTDRYLKVRKVLNPRPLLLASRYTFTHPALSLFLFYFSFHLFLFPPASAQCPRFQPVACLSFRVLFTKQPLSPINLSVDIPSHWSFMMASIRTCTSLSNGSLLKPAVCAPSFNPQKEPSKCKAAGSLTLPDPR